jgi:tight adherence protein C
MLILVLGLFCLGGAIFIVGQLVTEPSQERARFFKKVASYGETRQVLRATEEGARERLVTPTVERLARLVLRVNPKTTLESVSYKLVSAGLSRRISPSTFLALKAACPIALIILAILLGGAASNPLLGFVFVFALGALGFIAPDFVINSKIKSRQEAIRAQLPDALDLLAVSVEAGLGFDGAVSKLTQSLEGPLIDEFNLTLSEMRVGESRPEALRKLSERCQVPELSAFSRALIQADTLGISLGRILRVQAADTREKRQAAAEEKAMKAPIKMLFPTVLFIFPVLFIVTIGPAVLGFKGLFG